METQKIYVIVHFIGGCPESFFYSEAEAYFKCWLLNKEGQHSTYLVKEVCLNKPEVLDKKKLAKYLKYTETQMKESIDRGLKETTERLRDTQKSISLHEKIKSLLN